MVGIFASERITDTGPATKKGVDRPMQTTYFIYEARCSSPELIFHAGGYMKTGVLFTDRELDFISVLWRLGSAP